MSEKPGNQNATFSTDPEAAIKSYFELGFHLEPEVWSARECEEIIRASEHFPSFKDGTFAPSMQAHKTDSAFLTAMRNATLVSIMERLCSGRVSGLQSVYYYGRPGTPGFTMHQDNAFVEAKPDAFATAWVALQDVTPEMGGLVGYPGSHREPILPIVPVDSPIQSVSQDTNAHREEAVLPPAYKPVELFVPMGAVLFMHSHFVHSSNTNSTEKFRRALVLTYIRSGEQFRPGFTAQRAEVEVY